MSFLFCGRRRTQLSPISTERRLVTLESEVARLQKELVSLKETSFLSQQHQQLNSSVLIFTPPACPPSAPLSLSSSPSSVLPLFPLLVPPSSSSPSNESLSQPTLIAPFTPLPSPIAATHKAPSPFPPSAEILLSPPIAPPFSPFVSIQSKSFFPSLSTPLTIATTTTTDSLSFLASFSPDGLISTSSLTSSLDSLIMTIQPPTPPPLSSPLLSSPLPASRPVPSRVLRPLTSPSLNQGFNLTEVTNVKLLKPRSARKPAVEKGISLDAILNVKLRARTRTSQRKSKALSQRKRGFINTPSNKENVDTFFKDALRMKFKRLREQEEADELEWQDQKKNKYSQTPF